MSNSVVLVKNNDEGEKRVLNARGKYAFFMESSTIEYKLRRKCELKKIGEELDSKDYGIAMPASKCHAIIIYVYYVVYPSYYINIKLKHISINVEKNKATWVS